MSYLFLFTPSLSHFINMDCTSFSRHTVEGTRDPGGPKSLPSKSIHSSGWGCTLKGIGAKCEFRTNI